MFIRPNGRRTGVTLVELLVVMVIMVIVATIVVAFAPGFQDAQKAARGADQLQMWLVSARQMAKSARVPTGLRLVINNGQVNELQYIQQPPNYTVPFAVPAQSGGLQQAVATLSVSTNPAGVSSVILNMPTALAAGQQPGDFSGGIGLLLPNGTNTDRTTWPVQAGDYLVIHRNIYCVSSTPNFAATSGVPAYANLCNQFDLNTPLTGTVTSISPTTDYYFVRGPRPLPGESTLKLPQDVIIDLTQSRPSATGTGTLDILFSPSGDVISGTFTPPAPSTVINVTTAFDPSNKLIFWVMDVTKKSIGTNSNGTTNGNAQDTLIAVSTRTGMVAAQPVNLGGSDLYLYTKDGRTSGL